MTDSWQRPNTSEVAKSSHRFGTCITTWYHSIMGTWLRVTCVCMTMDFLILRSDCLNELYPLSWIAAQTPDVWKTNVSVASFQYRFFFQSCLLVKLRLVTFQRSIITHNSFHLAGFNNVEPCQRIRAKIISFNRI